MSTKSKHSGTGIYAGGPTVPADGVKKPNPISNFLWWLLVGSAVLLTLYQAIAD
jgi:hypothetical protein